MAGAVGGRWRYLGEPVARAACAGSSAAVRGADDLVLAVVAGHGPGVALERGSHLLVAVAGLPHARHEPGGAPPPLPPGGPARSGSSPPRRYTRAGGRWEAGGGHEATAAANAHLSAQDRGGRHVGLGVH